MGPDHISFFVVEANTRGNNCPVGGNTCFHSQCLSATAGWAWQSRTAQEAERMPACTSRSSLFSPSLITARLPAYEMVAFVLTAIFPSRLRSHRHVQGSSFQIS